MHNDALVFGECDDATIARDALEALPQSLYRSLPWPAHTLEACVKIVAEARRTNNPRRVRAWIDFERSTPAGNELMGCLDNVLHQLTLPGEGFADRVRFANKVRQDALDYVRTTTAVADADAEFDAGATAIADGLMAALRLHDERLADHSEATAELARRLAVAAGCDSRTIARTVLAARLHDIGKMRISRTITAKPLPLTAAEREEVRSYPSIGAQTLAALPGLAELAPIVRAQREWVDGSGYPDGATEQQIPIESRIIAVADAFHTMTIDRPHRKARSLNEASEELFSRRGTQFDAGLVTALATTLGYRGRIARSA